MPIIIKKKKKLRRDFQSQSNRNVKVQGDFYYAFTLMAANDRQIFKNSLAVWPIYSSVQTAKKSKFV